MVGKRMLLHKCMGIYQVRSSILDELSGTDASALIWALGIVLTDHENRKYLNVLRDIPEHKEWIESMVSAGNKVMLIGSDLYRLFERISSPALFSRGEGETRLCLWLAVVPWRVMDDEKLQGSHSMPRNGDDILANPTSGIPWRDPQISPAGQGQWASTAFVCRFDHMTELPGFHGHRDWHISTIPNENNIAVVFYANRSETKFGIKACLTPCQRQLDYATVVDKHAISCYATLTGSQEVPNDGTGFNVPLLALKYGPLPRTLYTGPEARCYAVAWYDVNETKFGVSDSLPRDSLTRRPEIPSTMGIVLSTLGEVTRSDLFGAHDFIIPFSESVHSC